MSVGAWALPVLPLCLRLDVQPLFLPVIIKSVVPKRNIYIYGQRNLDRPSRKPKGASGRATGKRLLPDVPFTVPEHSPLLEQGGITGYVPSPLPGLVTGAIIREAHAMPKRPENVHDPHDHRWGRKELVPTVPRLSPEPIERNGVRRRPFKVEIRKKTNQATGARLQMKCEH